MNNDILKTIAVKKAGMNMVDKIGTYYIYQLSDEWQKKEILASDAAKEAVSIQDFEEILQDKNICNIIVSPYLVNKILLEKILSRHHDEKYIFLDM